MCLVYKDTVIFCACKIERQFFFIPVFGCQVGSLFLVILSLVLWLLNVVDCLFYNTDFQFFLAAKYGIWLTVFFTLNFRIQGYPCRKFFYSF